MAIDAKQVSELREQTGAGMMDAKKALQEADGDTEKAIEVLRKKGMNKAEKKAGREMAEGRVHAYIHMNGKLGAMVEVSCETDFVARTEAFIELCNDLAMHVSAADPVYLTREDVPKDLVEKEQELAAEAMREQAKPEDVIDKIVEGKMNKWYSEVCLMEQAYIKDEDVSVEEFVKSKVASLGENIQVNRFSRFIIS